MSTLSLHYYFNNEPAWNNSLKAEEQFFFKNKNGYNSSIALQTSRY